MLPAICHSNFFGFESLDVNFGVHDDRVSGPTSSRIQRVPDEYAWKHLCAKLMKKTFVFRRRWIKTLFNNVSLDHREILAGSTEH